MTATIPQQRQAAYRGVIYGIDVIDHDSFMAGALVVMPNDYVGKTRQRGRGRENQHRDKQPFADLIVGSPRVLWEGICTEDELDEMERRFIRDVEVRPRLNEKMNEDNPLMISKDDQRGQRWARDDAADRPRWQLPDRRDRSSLLDWPDDRSPAQRMSDHPRKATRKWSPRQIKVGLWSSSWVLTLVATWAGHIHFGLPVTWARIGLSGSIMYVVLLGWSLAGNPLPRRWTGKARRRRKVRR